MSKQATIKRFFRPVLGLVLIALLISQLDTKKLLNVLVNADYGWFISGLYFVDHFESTFGSPLEKKSSIIWAWRLAISGWYFFMRRHYRRIRYCLAAS